MQLPEDVRALEDCPFPVEWQPVVSILQFQTPEIDGLALRDTLLRKEMIRVVQVCHGLGCISKCMVAVAMTCRDAFNTKFSANGMCAGSARDGM